LHNTMLINWSNARGKGCLLGLLEAMKTMVKLWLAHTTSSPLRFSFFFGKVSPSGWGKASFLLRVSGKNLKSSSGFFMSFSFLVLPLFRLCSSPARSYAFYVFVSWVHPCSKSLSISLCLTLPCICPFLFFFF
jgi:hypothetical protein